MSKFGEVLEATINDRHDSQVAVADYINDWLDHLDLDAELAELVRIARKKDRDQLEPVIEIIRDHQRRRARTTSRTTSQAAVSKWKKGRTAPSPEKWLAVARYLDLSLPEVYDMISSGTEPRSIPALRQALAAAETTIDELNRRLQEREAELERAERALRHVERTQAGLEQRLDQLEAEVAAGAGGECVDGVRAGV